MVSAGGTSFLVDLPEVVNLAEGDVFRLSCGTCVRVRAAQEDLLEISSVNLSRMAWHIGNLHAPCQIESNRLLVQSDHVLADMLLGLGAALREVSEPFQPEGGAYGHGRAIGHSH